jgi:hypothetical protein
VSKFPWLADATSTPPSDADESLASSIRNGEVRINDIVVDAIVRCSMCLAGEEALKSFEISEVQAFRLISNVEGLVDAFIRYGNYSPDRLRVAIKQEGQDEALVRIINKCVEFLETTSAEWSDKTEDIIKYINFVSLVVDAKFVTWYVRSGSIGGPLARLTAIVNRYRSVLFTDQQNWMKSSESSTKLEMNLQSRTEPRYDGRLFYYELK